MTKAVKSRKQQEEEDAQEFKQAMLLKSDGATKRADGGSLFVAVAALVAAVVAALFFELYVLRAPTHLGVLAGGTVVTAVLLYTAYDRAAQKALKRAQKNGTPIFVVEGKQQKTADSVIYFALFEVNFWFFVFFGFLAAVVLPLLNSKEVQSAAGKQTFGLVHYAASSAVPALLLALSGRTKYF